LKSLLLLERKYADILNDEDLTGVKIEKKKKKRKNRESIDLKGTISLTNNSNNIKTLDTQSNMSRSLDETMNNKSNQSKTNTKPNLRYNNKVDLHSSSDNIKLKDEVKVKTNLKQKTDSKNVKYINQLNLRSSLPAINPHKKNLDLIEKLNLKADTGKFYTREINKDFPQNEEVYLYSSQRKSYFGDYMEKLRQKFEKDKDHYYTYSSKYLTLSFPYNKNTNVEYEKYIENKKKWLVEGGFNRYIPKTKEYVYIPKKNNEL